MSGERLVKVDLDYEHRTALKDAVGKIKARLNFLEDRLHYNDQERPEEEWDTLVQLRPLVEDETAKEALDIIENHLTA